MKSTITILISLLLLSPAIALGQTVIGSVVAPASYSLLELSTKTIKGGIRMPQLTTVERDKLTTPTFVSDVGAKGLIIYNTDTKAIEFWNGSKWSLMVDQDNMNASVSDVIDGLGIPRPAVFQLEKDQKDFLSSATDGVTNEIPMSQIVNNITNSISFNQATNTITFQPGTYTVTFAYEGLHNATACTISSYFIDFPTNDSTRRRRIHTTASHKQGDMASHGGTITYTTKLTKSVNWIPRLGRGQSGNCYGAGLSLAAYVTQLSILKN
jgi:hypothetical protein